VLTCVVALPVWRPVDQVTEAPDGLLAYAPEGVTAVLAVTAGEIASGTPRSGALARVPDPRPGLCLDSRVEVIPAEAWAANASS
jgi:hypothetical protein